MQPDKEKVEKLKQLASSGFLTVYASNLKFLNKVEIDDLEKEKILLFRGYSDEVTCRKCPSQPCTVNPKLVTYPNGESMGVSGCVNPEEGGMLEFELDELKYWDIDSEKLGIRKSTLECEQITNSVKSLNIRVANIIIKHPNANSEEIARIIESTSGSVRTTPAWKKRKQLRESYDLKKGWKDSEGNMDAFSNQEITEEHWDIYNMFQQYKSEKNIEYPSISLIAQKLNLTEARASDLLKQSQAMLNFSADHMN